MKQFENKNLNKKQKGLMMLKDILESKKVLENDEFEVTEHNGFLKRLEKKLKKY